MTEDELQTRVIENIRSLRKKKGLSQEKLADKADISRQMMNDIEGRRRWLTKGTLVKLANALEVDVHELFVPSAEENNTMKTAYDAITKKVVAQVKHAVDKALDEEAIRVVKSMPKWTPAMNNDRPCASFFRLPVNFKLNR